MKHPIQPLEKSGDCLRFKPNKIVQYLLDNNGTIDLNTIARQNFPQDDQEQFAQLIGYSLSGFGSLSYVSDETFEAAKIMYDNPETSTSEARLAYLEELVVKLKDAFRQPISDLYGIHPDDLGKYENDMKMTGGNFDSGCSLKDVIPVDERLRKADDLLAALIDHIDTGEGFKSIRKQALHIKHILQGYDK